MTNIEGHDPIGEDAAITAAYDDRNAYARALYAALKVIERFNVTAEVQDDATSAQGWPVVCIAVMDRPGAGPRSQIRLHVRPEEAVRWLALGATDSRGRTEMFKYDEEAPTSRDALSLLIVKLLRA